MSKKLFISHSTKDDAHVDRIADALEAAGFSVWVDHRHGIKPGDASWDEAIRKAIVEADAGIFLMSEHSLASEICGAECLLVRELGDPLYVMRQEACKPENIWLYIKQIQYADLVTDFDNGINDLIRVLGGETSEELPKGVRATFTGLDTMRLYLPYLNNPLRGRDEDIKQIQSKLGAHVLQIVGPGGLGKSRLAAEIAINHPDGSIWHRCSPVSEPAELMALLREHLKLTADTNLTNVLAVLSEKKPLIIIDNAEDVPDGSDKHRAYADLLQQIVGRGVPAILTSRVGWTEIKPRREYGPAAVSLETATQIALDFAAAEDVALSESQARDLAAKARLHPRLIEFSVGQLHERNIGSVLRQLSELKHDDIKQALDEMITKTVAQMAAQAKHGADAKSLLHNMTILQATFPLDAIKVIAPDAIKEDGDRLEDALVTLQRWQFVRRDLSSERYSLGELVREALGQPDDAVFWPYALYYITERAEEVFSLPLKQWIDHEHDLPNILALGDALVQRMPQSISSLEGQSDTNKLLIAAALSFALNTRRFVTNRISYRRLAWLEMGLAAAQAWNDTKRVTLFLSTLGRVWSDLGESRKALAYHEQALLLEREIGDLTGEATALNNIGTVWSALGEKHKALAYHEQALPLRRAVEDRAGEATTLNNIGHVWTRLGKKRKALEYFEQALLLHRALGDNDGAATALNNIGTVWGDLGEKHKALEYIEQALSLRHAEGDLSGEATTLNNIGHVWFALGEKHKALAYHEQALPLRRAVEDREGEATTLNNIGLVWSALGEKHKALAYHEQALAFHRTVEDREGEATTLNNIGAVWDDLGEKRKALELYEQALSLASLVEDQHAEAAICMNISKIHDELGELDQAIANVRRCVELDEQVENPGLESSRQELERLIHKRDEARRD